MGSDTACFLGVKPGFAPYQLGGCLASLCLTSLICKVGTIGMHLFGFYEELALWNRAIQAEKMSGGDKRGDGRSG